MSPAVLLASVNEEIEIKVRPIQIREEIRLIKGDLLLFIEQVDYRWGDDNGVGLLAEDSEIVIFIDSLAVFVFESNF